MAIPVGISKKDYKELSSLLKSKPEIVCLNERAHLLTVLVARDLLMKGESNLAKVVKGYDND